MTAQRARKSTSREVLYGEDSESALPPTSSRSNSNTVPPSPSTSASTSSKTPNPPSTPTKQRVRQASGLSATGVGSPGSGEVREEGSFKFLDISDQEAESIRRDWARKLGISVPTRLPVDEMSHDAGPVMSDEEFSSFIHTHLGPPASGSGSGSGSVSGSGSGSGSMQDLAT